MNKGRKALFFIPAHYKKERPQKGAVLFEKLDRYWRTIRGVMKMMSSALASLLVFVLKR